MPFLLFLLTSGLTVHFTQARSKRPSIVYLEIEYIPRPPVRNCIIPFWISDLLASILLFPDIFWYFTAHCNRPYSYNIMQRNHSIDTFDFSGETMKWDENGNLTLWHMHLILSPVQFNTSGKVSLIVRKWPISF